MEKIEVEILEYKNDSNVTIDSKGELSDFSFPNETHFEIELERDISNDDISIKVDELAKKINSRTHNLQELTISYHIKHRMVDKLIEKRWQNESISDRTVLTDLSNWKFMDSIISSSKGSKLESEERSFNSLNNNISSVVFFNQVLDRFSKCEWLSLFQLQGNLVYELKSETERDYNSIGLYIILKRLEVTK